MLEKFFPDLFLQKVQDIDFDLLKNQNIKGLILDIDNTLISNLVKEPGQEILQWLEEARDKDFKLCLVSNASRARVSIFNNKMDILTIHRAVKPLKRPFISAANMMSLMPKEIAVVGDQIFTDVYGGNRMEMFTILVARINPKELLVIKIKRIAERFILSKYKNKMNKE